MKPDRYLAYGTVIATALDLSAYLCPAGDADSNILHLDVENGEPADLSHRTNLSTSHGREVALYSDRDLTASTKGQPWCFEVRDVVRFSWAGGTDGIRVESLGQCTDQLLAFWLIHIFLPLYFTLEGKYEFIHACSVEVGGKTILFTAPSHGGKSTLTDYFIRQGHALVSDDKVATYLEHGTCLAVPSHPNHRPYRKFEDLGFRVEAFDPGPRPVDAIYALHRAGAESEVKIEEITGHRKFAAVRPSYLFDFGFLREKRLKYLGELLDRVGVYRVLVPWELERLQDVHDAIAGHAGESV